MSAIIARKLIVCLCSVLAVLAVTACGGSESSAQPHDSSAPDPYVEGISSIISTLEQSLSVVSDEVPRMINASAEFTDRGEASELGSRDRGNAPEELLQVYLAGSAIFAQEGIILADLLERVRQISPPKAAKQHHELLELYVKEKTTGVKKLSQEFSREDINCCLIAIIARWDSDSRWAAGKKKEMNLEALRLGYPELH